MPKKPTRNKRTVSPQFELPIEFRTDMVGEELPLYLIPENPSERDYQRLMEYEMDRMDDSDE